jgi:hypothetical protein
MVAAVITLPRYALRPGEEDPFMRNLLSVRRSWIPRIAASDLFVAAAWLVVLAGDLYLVARPVREPSIDLYSYYIGASTIAQERPLYDIAVHQSVAASLGIVNADIYAYPPTLGVLIRPLLAVSPVTASLLWLGVNVLFLVAALLMVLKAVPVPDGRVRTVVLLLPLFYAPVHMTLYLGQANLLILFLVLVAYWASVRRYVAVCGLALALCAWIKLWPIALIAYFGWKREWKVLLAACAGLMLIGACTILVAGMRPMNDFFAVMLPTLLAGTQRGLDHMNHSIPGFFAKVFDPSSPYVSPLLRDPELARWGARAANLLVVAISALACSFPSRVQGRRQLLTDLTIVMIASSLISARLWDSNLVVLLPAIILLAPQPGEWTRWTWIGLAIACVSFAAIDSYRVLWTVANMRKAMLPWYVLGLPTVGILGIWLLLVVGRLRNPLRV